MSDEETNARTRSRHVTHPRSRIKGPLEFRFTLYICGATEKSQKAVANTRRLCDEHLPGHYFLEIIDLYRQPELAQSKDIFAIPTLIREFPLPIRRFIGDLSENKRLVDQMTPRNAIDR